MTAPARPNAQAAEAPRRAGLSRSGAVAPSVPLDTGRGAAAAAVPDRHAAAVPDRRGPAVPDRRGPAVPDRHRAPLRVVAPRPRPRRHGARRTALLALAITVAAPLSVAGLYADMTTGQVHLTRLQQELTAEQQRQSTLELRVAELENPSTIVAEARVQGMVLPASVVEIPEVSLGVVAAANGSSASRSPARSGSTQGTTR